MRRRTGGQAVVQALEAAGVEVVFGIMAQEQDLAGRTISVDQFNPDFVRFGRAFGAQSRRPFCVAELGQALVEAHDMGGPWLIDVLVRLPWPGKLAETRGV